jgi:hypothetical protein
MDRREGGSLPALLEALDDGTNEATLQVVLVVASRRVRPEVCQCPYLDAIGLDSNEAVSRTDTLATRSGSVVVQ